MKSYQFDRHCHNLPELNRLYPVALWCAWGDLVQISGYDLPVLGDAVPPSIGAPFCDFYRGYLTPNYPDRVAAEETELTLNPMQRPDCIEWKIKILATEAMFFKLAVALPEHGWYVIKTHKEVAEGAGPATFVELNPNLYKTSITLRVKRYPEKPKSKPQLWAEYKRLGGGNLKYIKASVIELAVAIKTLHMSRIRFEIKESFIRRFEQDVTP